MKLSTHSPVMKVTGTIFMTLFILLASFRSAGSEAAAAPPSGVWIPTGSLTIGRHTHTATKLNDGSVIVVGGSAQGTFNGPGLTSVERYYPSSNTWIVGPSLHQARQGHTATLLPIGQVLIAGGQDGPTFLASMELYDPNTNSWSLTTPLNQARYNHATILLHDGRIVVIGGFNANEGTLAAVEVFNPADNSVAQMPPMNTPRNGHSAILLDDYRILVIGGFNQSQSWLASAEIYDPVSGTWSATSPLFAHGVAHSTTRLADGQILVVGGAFGSGPPGISDKAEIFSPASGTWQAVASLSVTRHAHTASVLSDGRIMLAGGDDGGGQRHNSVEIFDPHSGSWSLTAAMIDARSSHSATVLDNNTILVAGGFSSSATSLASAELFVQNDPPDCSVARPNHDNLWPPNHKFVPIELIGVMDPDGDPVVVTINSIFQDEPINAPGSGNTSPDGQGVGTSTAQVRAERSDDGNGRVYHIGFSADDGRGGTCTGEVLVGVPHNQGQEAIDDGALYDSTVP